MDNTRNYEKFERVLYYLSWAALPNIFLFSLYNQNKNLGNFYLSQTLLLALLLAGVSVIMGVIVKAVTRQLEASLLILFLTWLVFWMFATFTEMLGLPNRILVYLVWMGILGVGAIVLRFLKLPFYRIRTVFNALAGVICMLFVFNFIPSIFANVPTNNSNNGNEAVAFQIRNEFNVDHSLPSPDIYWIHVDGAMNLHDMEYFFDQDLNDLRDGLNSRGFNINETATFPSFNTIHSMPALFSPDFHDSFMGGVLSENKDLLRSGRNEGVQHRMEEAGINLAEDVAPYHELFHAFLNANYRTVQIAGLYEEVYAPLDIFMRTGRSEEADEAPLLITELADEIRGGFWSNAADLVELLSITTPLPQRLVNVAREGHLEWQPIPEHNEIVDALTQDTQNFLLERQLYRRLVESFTIEEPRLVFLELMFTHPNRLTWQDPEIGDDWSGRDPSRVELIPDAFDYGMMVTSNLVDLILERNPDAVIVIQSDHGPHLVRTQNALLDMGFTEQEVIQMSQSTFSAVRIPEIYGGLDEKLHPLNITRELVNRFVGENYELLEK